MVLLPMMIVAAQVASPYRPVPLDDAPTVSKDRPAKAVCNGKAQKMVIPKGSGKEVGNLPHSSGNRFATLDAYLAHLECYNGPIDLPWWKQISPGVYQLMTTATNAKREVATREQLLERFGFSQ